MSFKIRYTQTGHFNQIIDNFKNGLPNQENFDKTINLLKDLKSDLNSSTTESSKLIKDIDSVIDFLCEIDPSSSNCFLSIDNKNSALELLNLKEVSFNSKTCLPITEIRMFNNKYIVHLLTNYSDCLIKINVISKSSTESGKYTAGVSEKSVRILNAYNNPIAKYIYSISCKVSEYCN